MVNRLFVQFAIKISDGGVQILQTTRVLTQKIWINAISAEIQKDEFITLRLKHGCQHLSASRGVKRCEYFLMLNANKNTRGKTAHIL